MGGRSMLHGEIYGIVFDHHSLILGSKGRCDLLRLRFEDETNWEHSGPKTKNNAYDLSMWPCLTPSGRAGR